VWSLSRGDPCESFATLRHSHHGTPESVADVPTPIEDRESCPLTRLPLRRRHGSGRAAAALAVRLAEAEALIAAAMNLDTAGRSCEQESACC
jgi:hypothetical protein